MVDSGGWYDRKDNKHPFRTIVDTMIVASMGTPGGGKSFITPRFQRHFNIVAFANFDENSLNTIFRNLLKWHFREGGFSPDVAGLEAKIVQATFKIYEKIQQDLRPTPAKTHYTFNLRDFSKIICGMCNCKKNQLTDSPTTVRLWAHEAVRILGDRLINDEDRMWMLEAVKECVRAPFSANFDTTFAHLDNNGDNKIDTLNEFRGLLFGDIFTAFGMPDRVYEEIKDKH
jgi:dynein heavy chain